MMNKIDITINGLQQICSDLRSKHAQAANDLLAVRGELSMKSTTLERAELFRREQKNLIALGTLLGEQIEHINTTIKILGGLNG